MCGCNDNLKKKKGNCGALQWSRTVEGLGSDSG